MTGRMKSVFFCTVGIAMLAANVSAETSAKLEGVFTDWSVYTRSVNGDKICFVLAKPSSKAPRSVKHGNIYFMIANWKSGTAREQPSLLTGYTLKREIAPSARIGSAKFPMFAADNEAFVEDNSDERKLVRAMRKGSSMRVDAVSTRGTRTSYEFSLRGVTAALSRAKNVCR